MDGRLRMTQPSFANRWNVDLIEDYYHRWRDDPGSVADSWRVFFEGYELGQGANGEVADEAALRLAHSQANIARLVDAYRRVGHFLAHLDPLSEPRKSLDLLDLK